jgi:hypothetical protein
MGTALIFIPVLLFSAAAGASIIINIRDAGWHADIQTYDGRRKLLKLGYERLEMIRLRPKTYRRGYHSASDYSVIPLDAPMKPERSKTNRVWKSITKLTSFDSPFSFQCEDRFDELRVYGYKNGEKHLVYTYAYYPENYNDVKNKVAAYNKKGIQ